MKALKILGYTLGVLHSSLHTLIGLLLIAVYIPKKIRWSQGCLEIVPKWIAGDPGAQTHGIVIFYKDEWQMGRERLRIHERRHVLHTFILGSVPYIVSYLLHFFYNFAFHAPHGDKAEPRWKRAYRRIWSERMAYGYVKEYDKGEHPGAWGSKG